MVELFESSSHPQLITPQRQLQRQPHGSLGLPQTSHHLFQAFRTSIKSTCEVPLASPAVASKQLTPSKTVPVHLHSDCNRMIALDRSNFITHSQHRFGRLFHTAFTLRLEYQHSLHDITQQHTHNMCKIWTFKYTCKHELKVRRSECRGTVKEGLTSEKALCKRTPTIRLKASSDCGECKLTAANEILDQELKTFDLASQEEASPDDQCEERRESKTKDIESRRDRLPNCFPAAMNWRSPSTSRFGQKPGEKLSATKRTTSLLRTEVKQDDIHNEAAWTGDVEDAIASTEWEADTMGNGSNFSDGWDDWGTGFKTLSEEIDEDKTSRADEGLPDPCRDQTELDVFDEDDHNATPDDEGNTETIANISNAPPPTNAQHNEVTVHCISDHNMPFPNASQLIHAVDPTLHAHLQAPETRSSASSEYPKCTKSAYSTLTSTPSLTPYDGKFNGFPLPAPPQDISAPLRQQVLSSSEPPKSWLSVSETPHLRDHEPGSPTVVVNGRDERAADALLASGAHEIGRVSVANKEEHADINLGRIRREKLRLAWRKEGWGKWVEDSSRCYELVRVGS